jgi:thiosulfate dehydrogenase
MIYASMSPRHNSAYASHMYAAPPQLWKKHGAHGAVGVSDEELGFAYWFVAHGVRPSLLANLFDTEMWRVSLLLKNANKDLPAPVTQILNARKPRYLGAFRYA